MKLPKWHKSTFKKSHLNSEPIPTKTKGNANKNKQAPTSLNLCRWYSGQSGRQGGGAAGGAGDAGGGGAGAAPPTMRVHACAVQGHSTHFKLDTPERWNVYISLISFYCSRGGARARTTHYERVCCFMISVFPVYFFFTPGTSNKVVARF